MHEAEAKIIYVILGGPLNHRKSVAGSVAADLGQDWKRYCP